MEAGTARSSKPDGGAEELERTTALGLFNVAESYWRAAAHLHSARLKRRITTHLCGSFSIMPLSSI